MSLVRLVETLFVLLMFSFASRRLLVRAFTSHVGGTSSRQAAVRPVAFRVAQSFSTRAEATVEEDLDAALDDILGTTKLEAESNGVKTNGVDTGTHIEGSHPIPKTLVEKVCTVHSCLKLKRSTRKASQDCQMNEILTLNCSIPNIRTIPLISTIQSSCQPPILIG